MKKITSTVSALLIFLISFATDITVPDLKVAARTFSIVPKVGTASAHTQTSHLIEAVHGDIKTTVTLFEQGSNKFCLVTSSLGIESGELHNTIVAILSQALQITPAAIVTSGSHNHTIPVLLTDKDKRPASGTPQLMAWELGMDFVKKLQDVASQLTNSLVAVDVEWGKAEENRITYNRRGIRPNGKTYFIREEDRMLEGEGYRGLIDPDAKVVVFRSKAGKPVSALTFFTGHPVAAYNPEKMISYGQFPQVASDILSAYLGNIPVGFVQGCCGDINAKYMLTGTIQQAQQLGEYLGQTFIIAAKSLRPSKRTGLEWSREKVLVPSAPLPDEKSLQRDLDSIDTFVKRGNANDENTFECVGMNFPKALTPPYRARLVELVRPWYVWALDQYKTNNLRNVPTSLPIEIVVARFGDVGFVGLPFEPFVKIGLKIKQEANLPVVLTGGYTDGSYGYIPDASAADDREYMSGFFRYRGNIPPYKAPAGDACATVAVDKLNSFAR